MDINKQSQLGANSASTNTKSNHGAQVSVTAKEPKTPGINHGQEVRDVARKETANQTSKQMMNASILAAQEKVDLESGGKSMTLLYKAAIEAINKELSPTLGDNAIQKNAANNVDYSPEATAERIVSFATQFFPLHQERNSNMSLDEQLESFMGIIGGAIDQGFNEAKDILKGLQVLKGDIESGVNSTYDLVQKGLQSFRDNIIPPKTA
ncbi:conserved hypothetical protein [Shewanella denitrificans OS217]|jgi:hypothetical protein|uniref:DUF5610 domain-containing protein n=1 Tax=Shewanella denitrificans (strain OS217 / ATCC BAA-1090 / DSM 15013) TaxID=318161 RepID=Q12K51_SHEDO|nr:DUF5610 domain-containing protein [Shewanella denitrificans]ABE56175.1 conserved hypothetical protein [Shewanella denitrificans OS217]